MEPDTYSDDLSSDVGVDYTQLRDFLRDGKWKEADAETGRVMLEVSERGKEGWLNVEGIENFPCTDLRTINELWIKYSGGRFGFSVQKRIWKEVGATGEFDYETWCKFAKRVGWLSHDYWERWFYWSELTFTTLAPEGHLPWFRWGGKGGFGMSLLATLSYRAKTCNL